MLSLTVLWSIQHKIAVQIASFYSSRNNDFRHQHPLNCRREIFTPSPSRHSATTIERKQVSSLFAARSKRLCETQRAQRKLRGSFFRVTTWLMNTALWSSTIDTVCDVTPAAYNSPTHIAPPRPCMYIDSASLGIRLLCDRWVATADTTRSRLCTRPVSTKLPGMIRFSFASVQGLKRCLQSDLPLLPTPVALPNTRHNFALTHRRAKAAQLTSAYHATTPLSHLHKPKVLPDDVVHGAGTRLQRSHHPKHERGVADTAVVLLAACPPLEPAARNKTGR